jgi:hypothetical protein
LTGENSRRSSLRRRRTSHAICNSVAAGISRCARWHDGWLAKQRRLNAYAIAVAGWRNARQYSHASRFGDMYLFIYRCLAT